MISNVSELYFISSEVIIVKPGLWPHNDRKSFIVETITQRGITVRCVKWLV